MPSDFFRRHFLFFRCGCIGLRRLLPSIGLGRTGLIADAAFKYDGAQGERVVCGESEVGVQLRNFGEILHGRSNQVQEG